MFENGLKHMWHDAKETVASTTLRNQTIITHIGKKHPPKTRSIHMRWNPHGCPFADQYWNATNVIVGTEIDRWQVADGARRESGAAPIAQ